MESIKKFFKSKYCIPIIVCAVIVFYFFCIYTSYSVLNNRDSRLFRWTIDSWSPRNNLQHGYLVPFIFIVMTMMGYRSAKMEKTEDHQLGVIVGCAGVVIGILCYLISIRCIQPRLALIGVPFLASGSWLFVLGWNKGKHFIVPSFILYFAVPVPGLNQLRMGL